MFRWKSLRLVVFCLLVVFMIVSAMAEQETVTLTVWDWWVSQSRPFLNKEIELFQQAYPYIKVKRSTIVVYRYKESIELAARSGTLPDIFVPDEAKIPEWGKAGFYYPLNRWMDEDFRKKFPKGVFAETRNMYNGNYISFPVNGFEYWTQLYINGEVFKKFGLVDEKGNTRIPKNWAEVRKFAKTISTKSKGKVSGFGIASKPTELFPNFMYEWARVAGGRAGDQALFLDVDLKTGRYNFNNEGFVRMFKFLLSLKKDKSLNANFLSIDDEALKYAFADGNIGMIMGGKWNQQGWAASHPNFTDYECVMIPPYDDKEGYLALCDTAASYYYAMSSNTKHPEEAWKFLEWFSRIDVNIRYVEAMMGTSIHAEANEKAKVKSRQYKQYLLIANKYPRLHPFPVGRNPELVNVKWQRPVPDSTNLFWGIMSGIIKEKDIRKALQDTEDRYNQALEKAFREAIAAGYKVSLDDLKFPDWNPLENYETKLRVQQ